MKNLISYCSILLLANGHTLFAQTLGRQVISCYGSTSVRSPIVMSATAGETVTPHLSKGSFMITQGFQQNNTDKPTKINEIEVVNNVSYELYPNPAQLVITVNLYLQKAATISFAIIDLQGKTLLKPSRADIQPPSYTQNFDISSFAAGTYFLKMVSADGKALKTLPFTKY